MNDNLFNHSKSQEFYLEIVKSPFLERIFLEMYLHPTSSSDISETFPLSSGNISFLLAKLAFIKKNNPELIKPTRKTLFISYDDIGEYHWIEDILEQNLFVDYLGNSKITSFNFSVSAFNSLYEVIVRFAKNVEVNIDVSRPETFELNDREFTHFVNYIRLLNVIYFSQTTVENYFRSRNNYMEKLFTVDYLERKAIVSDKERTELKNLIPIVGNRKWAKNLILSGRKVRHISQPEGEYFYLTSDNNIITNTFKSWEHENDDANMSPDGWEIYDENFLSLTEEIDGRKIYFYVKYIDSTHVHISYKKDDFSGLTIYHIAQLKDNVNYKKIIDWMETKRPKN